MRSIKFSIIFGFLFFALGVFGDIFKSVFAFSLGFLDVEKGGIHQVETFGKGFDFLRDKVYDRNYLYYFLIGFLVGFPVFYIKRKIDKWVAKNSKIHLN